MENEILDDDFGQDPNSPSVEYAGFGVRLVASLIDFVAMIPLIALGIYNSLSLKSLPIALVAILLSMAYKPLMEYYYGATLGKMAMRLQVVSQNFEEIDLSQSIIRYVPWLIGNAVNIAAVFLLFQSEAYLEAETYMELSLAQQEAPLTNIATLVSLIPLVSALIILFNDKEEAGHDMMAKTYCIRKR